MKQIIPKVLELDGSLVEEMYLLHDEIEIISIDWQSSIEGGTQGQ